MLVTLNIGRGPLAWPAPASGMYASEEPPAAVLLLMRELPYLLVGPAVLQLLVWRPRSRSEYMVRGIGPVDTLSAYMLGLLMFLCLMLRPLGQAEVPEVVCGLGASLSKAPPGGVSGSSGVPSLPMSHPSVSGYAPSPVVSNKVTLVTGPASSSCISGVGAPAPWGCCWNGLAC
jgi:hypothetical protein